MGRGHGLAGALGAVALAAACGGQPDPVANVPAECNPLSVEHCALPFPSALYQVEDASSRTGMRLDFPLGALPANAAGVELDPSILNGRDGFSANSLIVAAFPNGVSPQGLPPISDPEHSLSDDSATVVVDVTTGERVLHFAEVDESDPFAVPGERALLIRLLERLEPERTYAVAIRNSARDADGAELPMSAGFRAIVDGTPTGHERLESIRPRYPAVFDALETAGVPRGEVVLAWDFVTASDEAARSDMLVARDRALEAMGERGANLTFTVDRDEPHESPATDRIIHGTFDVPLVLTDGGAAKSVLARDADGLPEVVGTYTAPFSAIIPACAAENRPIPIVIYGHGLFGSLKESTGGYPRNFSNFACAAVFGTEWRGMSTRDVGDAANAMADANLVPNFLEKIVQGVLSFIALEQIVRGPMADADVFSVDGEPLLDTSRVTYYGISQGGIFGGTLMAYDPFIERGVLQVGAANYSLYIDRSSNWAEYSSLGRAAYGAPFDGIVLMAAFQGVWDATDPVTTLPGLIGARAEPVPGVGPKQILLQMAVGDAQVANVGTEYMARVAEIPTLAPSVRRVPAVGSVEGTASSALVIYDERPDPMPPETNQPAEKNGTHGSIRKLRATNEQIKRFFETGEIVQTCGQSSPAPCDCTAGACGAEITGLEYWP